MSERNYTRSLGEGVRDRYNLKGEKEKIELNLDYAEALTIADEDININWESYKDRFPRGDYP